MSVTLTVSIGKRTAPEFDRLKNLLVEYQFRFDGKKKLWTREAEPGYASHIQRHLTGKGARVQITERQEAAQGT